MEAFGYRQYYISSVYVWHMFRFDYIIFFGRNTTKNSMILYRLKHYLSTKYVSSIEWIISLGNWIRVWKHQFRCQAICYLYLECDHLLTCLNVWHGENEIIETDKIWIIPTSYMNMSFEKSHHPNIWVWM